jgi:creatinine amidohydrolase
MGEPITRPSVRLAELTAQEVRDGAWDTAVLPVGATEFHGDHLPYATDTLTAEGIAVRLAEGLGTALVLPPLAVGVSSHLLAWPWTLSVRPETLTATVVDIAGSLLHHGIARLLVVTAHDGNPAPVEAAARELQRRHGLAVAVLSGWQGLARRLLAGSPHDIDLDHGGQSEVSMVLHLAPHLARPERATDLPRQKMDHPVRVFGPFDNVVPHGHSGAASRGTAAEGAAILDAVTAEVLPFLRQLAANGWQNGAWMSGIERA